MATINDIGIPGFNPGILQPKLKNRWRVKFQRIAGANETENASPMSLQAVNVTRPTINYEEVPLHRYNSVGYVAGKHSFEPMTITLEDDIKGTATAVIQQQMETQQLLTGAQNGAFLATAGEGSIYKFVVLLELLDGSDVIVESWLCQGCFIQNVTYNDLDYTASDAVQITLNIRYDHAQQFLGEYKGQGIATGPAGTTST